MFCDCFFFNCQIDCLLCTSIKIYTLKVEHEHQYVSSVYNSTLSTQYVHNKLHFKFTNSSSNPIPSRTHIRHTHWEWDWMQYNKVKWLVFPMKLSRHNDRTLNTHCTPLTTTASHGQFSFTWVWSMFIDSQNQHINRKKIANVKRHVRKIQNYWHWPAWL